MIPKRLIYCRFGGQRFGEIERMCIESWKRVFPKTEYEWVELNEATFDVCKFDYALSCHAKKLYGYVADFARCYELATKGGIYVDTDMYMLKFDERILDGKLTIGNAKAPFKVKDSSECFSWGLVACDKGNMFMQTLLESFSDGSTATRKHSELMENTKRLFRSLENVNLRKLKGCETPIETEHAMIMPFDVFTCTHWMSDQFVTSYRTQGIHLYAGSWLKEGEVRMKTLKYRLEAFRRKYEAENYHH